MDAASNILKLVRQQCRANGVRFTITSKRPENFGSFCSSEKELLVSKIIRKHPNTKETRAAKKEEIAIVALHEMVHMWQWARKDPDDTAEVAGDYAYSILADYISGEQWASKSVLKQCLPIVTRVELEAEFTSIRIAKSMGLKMPSYTKWTKECKAYLYAWHVAVETGMWPSQKTRAKWRRHITADLNWDLTKSLLSKLCSITIENKELAATIWDGKHCLKK